MYTYMYMFIHTSVFVYACIHGCVYIYVCVFVYTYISLLLYKYATIHLCINSTCSYGGTSQRFGVGPTEWVLLVPQCESLVAELP